MTGPSGHFPPWDVSLSWPGEILDPSDPQIPEHIKAVAKRKFPTREEQKGELLANERYIVRLCGPVLEGISSWKEFIVFRSPDQLWSMEDGVKAGCVKVGLRLSGVVFGGWGWGRKCFEDAMAETGWWGEVEKDRVALELEEGREAKVQEVEGGMEGVVKVRKGKRGAVAELIGR